MPGQTNVGGLFVLGTVIKGDFTALNPTAQRVKRVSWPVGCMCFSCLSEPANRPATIEQAWQKIILQAKIKAFSQVSIAPSARLGYQSIVTCHGLGAMNANTGR